MFIHHDLQDKGPQSNKSVQIKLEFHCTLLIKEVLAYLKVSYTKEADTNLISISDCLSVGNTFTGKRKLNDPILFYTCGRRLYITLSIVYLELSYVFKKKTLSKFALCKYNGGGLVSVKPYFYLKWVLRSIFRMKPPQLE